MEIKKRYILLVLSFLIISCSSYKYLSGDLEGTYSKTDDNDIKLILNQKSFLYINEYKQEHLPSYDCCDTIAYGNWKINKEGYIELTTPEEISTSYLNVDVIEKEVKKSKDSLYVFIDNPIEKFSKNDNRKTSKLLYQLAISSNNNNFDNAIALRKFDKNKIAIAKKDNDLKINSIEVIVYVQSDISLSNLELREVYTMPYKVNNANTNSFNINIPKLNYGYLSYKRLENDYVKIVNKQKLVWNNVEFLR
ncbi:hypothetical protein ACFQ1M_08380 [Sungkyunkwania multivorans]|uniref:Lipoprotein n=1 Tax=Sungkyunkwania multivorans TaxID=1173618 RepID=A0ABW3CY47_9FLAO